MRRQELLHLARPAGQDVVSEITKEGEIMHLLAWIKLASGERVLE